MNLLELQTDKINRQVHFLYAQVFDEEETAGKNNTWLYDRAPDGYKFVLHKISIYVDRVRAWGVFALFDGHEYTHWNIFPGVESKEVIAYITTSNSPPLGVTEYLEGWECKEYTLGIRSTSTTASLKGCCVVWYYLRKMSLLEKLQYAVIQPRGQRYRKGGATTVERTERYGW